MKLAARGSRNHWDRLARLRVKLNQRPDRPTSAWIGRLNRPRTVRNGASGVEEVAVIRLVARLVRTLEAVEMLHLAVRWSSLGVAGGIL